jgi:hypothetical protein
MRHAADFPASPRAPWGPALLLGLLAACAIDDRNVDADSELPPRYNPNLNAQGGAPAPAQTGTGEGGASGAVPTSPLSSGGGTEGQTPGQLPGTGGADGSMSGGAGGADVIGMGVALTPLNGWVAPDSNGLGIQGNFFVASDASGGGPSSVTPSNFGRLGPDICVAGRAGPVSGAAEGLPDFGTDWGVVVGLNLSQAEGSTVLGTWSPVTPSGVVSGFSFVLTGPIIPSDLRFAVASSNGTFYCSQVFPDSGATQTRQLGELVTDCWNSGPGVPVPEGESFRSLEWSIATNTDYAVPFEFCISELQGVLE